MEIREYLRIFARYWWVIVGLTVLGGLVGFATSLFITPQYQSTATLFVATQNGNTATEAYQNNLFSTERVNSYASLATSEQVAARAVDQLKAPISAGELRSKISAAADPKTVLLSVSVTDPDPAQAQSYANAVAGQLVNLVSELETSRRGGTPAAGAIVVDEAGYPTEPAGIGLPLRIGLGVLAGLVLGIIVAILIGVLDKRLRGRESVEHQSDSSVIAALPASRVRTRTAVVDLSSDGAYPEAVRELRTNLRFCTTADGVRAPKVVAITSPMRGDGRSTVAVDLAAAFAETGKSVVLVDGDLRNPTLASRLPLTVPMRNAAQSKGLSTVLVGEHTVADGIVSGIPIGNHTIALLPAGPAAPRPGELWATDHSEDLLTELAEAYDYVVVDTPALDDCNDGAVVAALSDGALMLARLQHTTSTALRRALLALRGAGAAVLGTVVTFDHLRGRAGRDRAARDTATTRSAETRRDGPASGSGEGDTEVIGEGRLVGSTGPQQQSRSRHGSS
ncbi:AAA family ATPase [Mycolicibacterium flavescens]|uniref:non-specific protein-tyrosine kinase n=1 Tax=Mycolicibacterium flavescens TaxID=1776 RepID=A0A1E3RI93_MYCFV|nr:AAA family ATPase [Mycolicibacterium flavescens]ODQ89182.1 protein tyrosine kinase [Mycolicibacterium flavescens]